MQICIFVFFLIVNNDLIGNSDLLKLLTTEKLQLEIPFEVLKSFMRLMLREAW